MYLSLHLWDAECYGTVLTSLDIQLIMLLGGDSSLDLEKVVFHAFYFLTSFALAGFHVDLCAFHGIPVFRSH